jgi:hypothetical protein
MRNLTLLISQSDTNAPQITVLSSTFFGQITPTRSQSGHSYLTSTVPEFGDAYSPQDQTKCKSNIGDDYDIFVNCEDDFIHILTEQNGGGVDGMLNNKIIEIIKP